MALVMNARNLGVHVTTCSECSYLDHSSDHKSINQIFYWIAFVLMIALLRAVKVIPITYEHPVILFAFTLVTIVIGMGISFYKGTIGELRP